MGAILRHGGRVKAGAVVNDHRLVKYRRFPCDDAHGARVIGLGAHAVADGVFHQRLQAERRQLEPGGTKVVFHLQLVAKAQLLQRQIVSGVVQLSGKRDGLFLCQRVHVAPQIFRKFVHGVFRCRRVDAAEGLNHCQ